MLIRCPECDKEISDKVSVCIHCGYPLNNMDKNKISTSNTQCPICKNYSHKLNGIKDTCSVCGFVFNSKECKEIDPDLEIYPSLKKENEIHCPVCSSTNIEKISATSKVIGAVAFGLLSKTAKSQFKCKNCGYKF